MDAVKLNITPNYSKWLQPEGPCHYACTSYFARALGHLFPARISALSRRRQKWKHLEKPQVQPQHPTNSRPLNAFCPLLHHACQESLSTCLPVTLVPCPAVPCRLGPEVGAAEVHDAGGEAQQAPVAVGPVHPSCGRGEAVLLVGASQKMEGSVL